MSISDCIWSILKDATHCRANDGVRLADVSSSALDKVAKAGVTDTNI
jgi:hypothetical protein